MRDTIYYICIGLCIVLIGCKQNSTTSSYEVHGDPTQETGKAFKIDSLGKEVQIFIYPKSDFTRMMFQTQRQEVDKTKQQIQLLIQKAKNETERTNWIAYLNDISSGSAFLIPFTLTNWPFIVPSRVQKEPGDIYLAIARYQPDEADVVFLVRLKPNLTTKEVHNELEQVILNNSKDKKTLYKNAQIKTNSLFNLTGDLADPVLNELLQDQVFIKQD